MFNAPFNNILLYRGGVIWYIEIYFPDAGLLLPYKLPDFFWHKNCSGEDQLRLQ